MMDKSLRSGTAFSGVNKDAFQPHVPRGHTPPRAIDMLATTYTEIFRNGYLFNNVRVAGISDESGRHTLLFFIPPGEEEAQKATRFFNDMTLIRDNQMGVTPLIDPAQGTVSSHDLGEMLEMIRLLAQSYQLGFETPLKEFVTLTPASTEPETLTKEGEELLQNEPAILLHLQNSFGYASRRELYLEIGRAVVYQRSIAENQTPRYIRPTYSFEQIGRAVHAEGLKNVSPGSVKPDETFYFH